MLLACRNDVDLLSDANGDLSDEDFLVQQTIESSIRDRYGETQLLLCMACVLLYRSMQQQIVPDLATVLRVHAETHLSIDEHGECQCINVRRRHVWTDTKRAMTRPSFNSRIGLEVHFIGEEAQDAGGPLREYFRLLWKDMSADGSVFAGPEDRRLLMHNVVSLRREHYALIGRCIGLSLLNGGSGPHFLSPVVVSYLLGDELDLPVDEVTDFDVREGIIKVCKQIELLSYNVLQVHQTARVNRHGQ